MFYVKIVGDRWGRIGPDFPSRADAEEYARTLPWHMHAQVACIWDAR